jgi:hypothetical protein
MSRCEFSQQSMLESFTYCHNCIDDRLFPLYRLCENAISEYTMPKYH